MFFNRILGNKGPLSKGSAQAQVAGVKRDTMRVRERRARGTSKCLCDQITSIVLDCPRQIDFNRYWYGNYLGSNKTAAVNKDILERRKSLLLEILALIEIVFDFCRLFDIKCNASKAYIRITKFNRRQYEQMSVSHANDAMTRSKTVARLATRLTLTSSLFHRLLYTVDLLRKRHTSYYL